MKRLAMIGCCLAAVLAAVAPPRLAARPRAVTPPRDALGAIACHQAINPLQRDVSVQATMRPVTGTQTLQIKFSLNLTRTGAPATAVVASGLGQWLTPSDPTLGQRPGDIWKLSKPVYNLGGGSYQFSVGVPLAGRQGQGPQDGARCRARVARSRSCGPIWRCARSRSGRSRARPRATDISRWSSTRDRAPSGPFSLLFDPGVAGRELADEADHVAGRRPEHDGAVHRAGLRRREPAHGRGRPDRRRVDDSNRSNNALTVTCPAG